MKSKLLILPTILFFAVTTVSATFVFANTASTSQLTAAELLLQSLQSPAPTAQSATLTATSTTNSPQVLAVPIGISLPSLVQLNVNLVPDNAIVPQAPTQEASSSVESETVPPTIASSTAELISSLYAEVQTLEAQIALLHAPSATTTLSAAPASLSTTCAPLALTRNLALGSKGNDVFALQQFLETEKYYSYPSLTGYFGPVTEQAVEAFQSASGIEAVGEVGPITSAKIAALSSICEPATKSATTTATEATAAAATTTATPSSPSLTFGGGGEGGGGGGSPRDTTAPVITLSGSNPMTVAQGATFTDPGASATDNRDGTVNVSVSGSVDTSTIGVYTLTYSASDSAGNTASATRTVNVTDQTAPIISSIATSTVVGTAATITWSTNEAADTQVEYGITNAYGATTTLNATLSTSHSVTLSGLTNSTTYHFRVRSADAAGNIAYSSDESFSTAPPLPSLPLPVGAKVMAFGHSFVAIGWFTSAPTVPLTEIADVTDAVLPWIKYLDQRFNTDVWADASAPYYDPVNQPAASVNGAAQGIGGDQLIGISPSQPGALGRVDYVIARHPDIIYLEFGINDVINGNYTNANQIITYYDQLLEKIRAAGIWAVAETITPVTSAQIPDGDPRLQEITDFNNWLRAQAAANREGLKVVDTDPIFGAGRPNQSYWLQTDGLHPQDRGAYALAHDGLLPVLQSMVSAGNYYNTDPTVSNLMPDATMAGTSGSKGAGITGSVATNYSATIQTGASTVVASKEVIGNGYEKQVFTITPVADANTNHELRLSKTASSSLSSLGLAPGDWVQAMEYVELSPWNYWVRAQWSIFLDQGTTVKWTTITGRNLSTTKGYVLPNGGIGIWLVSDPFQIPAGVDNVHFNGGGAMLDLEWQGAATGTGVAKVSQPIFRKIADPRAAWNLP